MITDITEITDWATFNIRKKAMFFMFMVPWCIAGL